MGTEEPEDLRLLERQLAILDLASHCIACGMAFLSRCVARVLRVLGSQRDNLKYLQPTQGGRPHETYVMTFV